MRAQTQTARVIRALGNTAALARAVGRDMRLVSNWKRADRLPAWAIPQVQSVVDTLGGDARLREVIPLLGLPPGHARRAEVDRLLDEMEGQAPSLPSPAPAQPLGLSPERERVGFSPGGSSEAATLAGVAA